MYNVTGTVPIKYRPFPSCSVIYLEMMDLQEVGGVCGGWMELAQDRDRWRSLVSTVRNLRVSKMRGIS